MKLKKYPPVKDMHYYSVLQWHPEYRMHEVANLGVVVINPEKDLA